MLTDHIYFLDYSLNDSLLQILPGCHLEINNSAEGLQFFRKLIKPLNDYDYIITDDV